MDATAPFKRMEPNAATPARPAFREALAFWVKLGFISFGGPAGQIGIMHDFLVEKKRWISDSRFLHALNYCMLLPGPEAQQLATYIGWLLHGRWGGIAAGMFFVLPSMFILLALSMAYVTYGNLPWVMALFNGLKPAVIAIVLAALVKIGNRSLHTPFHWVVAAGAFVCIFFLNIPFPLIILGAIAKAALVRSMAPGLLRSSADKAAQREADEVRYYLNSDTPLRDAGFKPARLTGQVLLAALCWALPFVAFLLYSSDPAFWQRLSLFFTQAAFVTFGGAYAVLPYVAQVSVEKLGWLSSLEMIDGLALGETTPGPLIMVLAFVGFMAGYNHFEGSMAMGALGLLVTTFFTFLPCFLFIFAGAPIIERTRDNAWLKGVLSLVTAAVVGVVLNLTIYLGRAVLFPEGFAWDALVSWHLAWLLISFLALHHFKVNMMLWLCVSGLFGLAVFLVP
jgi:chromate transporter